MIVFSGNHLLSRILFLIEVIREKAFDKTKPDVNVQVQKPVFLCDWSSVFYDTWTIENQHRQFFVVDVADYVD